VVFARLANGVLRTDVYRDFQPVISTQPPLGYLPTTNVAFSKLSQHAALANQALDNDFKDVGASGSGGFAERQTQPGYLYLKPLLIDLKLPSKNQTIKSVIDKQRFPKEVQSVDETATRRPSGNARHRDEIEYHPRVSQRSSYQVVETQDEYLTDNSRRATPRYRGKVETRNPSHNSQDITTAIKALDHFLSRVLNDDGYNSEVHPPSNPALALVLSRYGRYVPGARNPRVYAHMAVNNIHNNKPFGSYKLECEELPTYVRR
ncbi:hypothetical protein WH47_10225, partial [Habropoda laboriosa]